MNTIHKTAIIGPNVQLGSNNYIGPNCYITGNTIIGDNNRFEAYCSIGTPPEHRDHFESTEGQVVIGNDNVVREFVTIHSSTIRTTTLEDNIIILNHSHIAHDMYIEKNTTISANVTMAGHCYIMEGANVALGAILHQRQLIGAYAMVGMGCVVTSTTPIEPGGIYIGSPARFLKTNHIGLDRASITSDQLKNLRKRYNTLKYGS